MRASHSPADRPRRRFLACAAAAAVLPLSALQAAAWTAEGLAPQPAATQPRRADFGVARPSPQARQLADWIADSRDHAGAPFVIVDKKQARVFVFDAGVQLRAHSPALLGSALGDDSVPGIGLRPIAQVLPAERTTPAGRFVAERGRNTQGEDVVWVDYDAAVSMHRVRTGNAAERRARRLATPSIDDNRISYGCINLPVAFYEKFIQPLFARSNALVYVLPDLKPVQQVFGSYEVAAPAPGGAGFGGTPGSRLP